MMIFLHILVFILVFILFAGECAMAAIWVKHIEKNKAVASFSQPVFFAYLSLPGWHSPSYGTDLR